MRFYAKIGKNKTEQKEKFGHLKRKGHSLEKHIA